jgi:Tol biopolymer transport system component
LGIGALAGGLVWAGCAPTQRENGGASAEVLAVASALSPEQASVERVEVTISARDMATITTRLARVGAGWQGIIGGIPAGFGRDFVGAAYADRSSSPTYSGAARGTTIRTDERAFVALVLQQTRAPVPFRNSAPAIESIVASSVEVAPGGTIRLAATASDPDGEALTYTWTASDGAVAQPSSSAGDATWTAPATDADVTFTLRVSDRRNAAAVVSFHARVRAAAERGSAAVTASFNHAPTVETMTADPTPLGAGQTVQLGLTTADPDGDPVASYAWSTGCSGAFATEAGASTREPRFTLSELPPDGSCTFAVTITDARGGTNTGELVVAAGAAASVAASPVVEGTFQSTETVAGGESVVFRVKSRDPAGGEPMTYWSSGDSGRVVSLRRTPDGEDEIAWTAPDCFSGTADVTASIYTASGGATGQVFHVSGTDPASCTLRPVERVSVSSDEVAGDGWSSQPAISGDGRYIAFVSAARNLVAEPLGSASFHVYRRDVSAGTTSLVSRSADGTAARFNSQSPSISADGRYVAFQGGNDDNVYVHDATTRQTVLASVDASNQARWGQKSAPSISGDGRHVCFLTPLALDPADTNDEWDVYVRDLDAGTTRRVSGNDGTPGRCALSYDGDVIAFTVRSPSPTDYLAHRVYVRDMRSSAVTLVASDAIAAVAISGDGKSLAYATTAALEPADVNAARDVHVQELETGILHAVSAGAPGAEGVLPSLSYDGKRVAYQEIAYSGPSSSTTHAVVMDLVTGSRVHQGVNARGDTSNQQTQEPVISSDGRRIVFASSATNLVGGDAPSTMHVFTADVIRR